MIMGESVTTLHDYDDGWEVTFLLEPGNFSGENSYPPPISFQGGHPCLYIYWGSTLMYGTKGGLCPPKIG